MPIAPLRARLLALSLLGLLGCTGLSVRTEPHGPAEAVPEARATDASRAPHDLALLHLDADGLALKGYDPVAYFPEGGGRARKGSPKLAARHAGVLYRFASEANRDRFLAAPERYEPDYGGWCAYAMADDETVDVDPESFLVTDGRLLLFFKSWYADTRARWRKDEAALRAKADRAWAAKITTARSSVDG